MGQTGSIVGYPAPLSSHLDSRVPCSRWAKGPQIATIEEVDAWVIVIIALVLVPIAVVWALAKSASLRGPAPRANPQRRVETLVTEAIPEEHPEDEEDVDAGAGAAARYEDEPGSPPSPPGAG